MSINHIKSFDTFDALSLSKLVMYRGNCNNLALSNQSLLNYFKTFKIILLRLIWKCQICQFFSVYIYWNYTIL